MREYKYSVRDQEGLLKSGMIEAESERAAANILLARHLTPIEISDDDTGKIKLPFSNRISVRDKSVLIRQLATMIGAGLPLAKALNSLKAQEKSAKLQKVLDQMVVDIEAGTSLSSALSRHQNVFNKIDINLVAAAEASGKLDEVLLKLADSTEKNYKIRKKIRSAFIYPAFIIVVVLIVLVMMIVYVLPQMASLYESFDVELPFVTQMLIDFSALVTQYYYIFLILIALIAFSFSVWIKSPMGHRMWNRLIVQVPVIGVFLKMTYVSIFSNTMRGLVGAGVPILESLNIVANSMPNIIYEEAIKKSSEKVKAGESLSKSLSDAGIFPVLVTQMIEVGEQTGEMEQLFENVANYYDDEIDNWVKSFQSLLEPFIIVFMAVVVGGMLIALMLPIFLFATNVGA